MTPDAAIISILKEQVNSYRALHDLLKEERACLVNIEADQIERISKEKDTLVMRLRLLEEERQRLIRQFAGDNGLDADINLEELGRVTGNVLFSDLRSQLLSLLQGIEEMNRFNAVLIDRSLHYVRSNTNFFNLFGKEKAPHSAGALLSKET